MWETIARISLNIEAKSANGAERNQYLADCIDLDALAQVIRREVQRQTNERALEVSLHYGDPSAASRTGAR